MTRIIVVGPGRAGGALGIALAAAGHQLTAVVGRNAEHASDLAQVLSTQAVSIDAPLPATDLLLISVRDDQIAGVASHLADTGVNAAAAVHVSGLNAVGALERLASVGLDIGSWHPLQTLPTAEAGATRLPGAWLAVTTDSEDLARLLRRLSRDIGGKPFHLADEHKPLYHAAAAAAANYVVSVLGLGQALAAAADVPFEAARPLVDAVVDNVFEMGAAGALTGPIARGDVGTVEAQLVGIRRHAPELEEDFRSFGRATARIAGTTERFEGIL